MAIPSFTLPKFYRNFAWLFLSLALVLLIFVFYLIWAKVTIIIIPATEEINQEFSFKVKEGGVDVLVDSDTVNGRIQEVEVESTQVFPATGSKPADSGTVGEVTIINNYSKEQALIATTRLTAPDDSKTVLVRLKNTVTVPAGSQVKVQVYVENTADFKPIKPMRFIIPGLWGPLQDKIYAENSETLGERGEIAMVTEEDLKVAEKTLKDNLYQQIVAEANKYLEPAETLWPRLVDEQSSEVNFTAKAGQEIAEFSAMMKFKALLVVFDESQVNTLARNKIKSALASDKKLASLNPKDFSYSIMDYNPGAKEATVKAMIKANSTITEGSQLLNKDNLAGKTEEEIKAYFSQYSAVKSVEVKFSPAWLKKTPRIKEKIAIQIGQ